MSKTSEDQAPSFGKGPFFMYCHFLQCGSPLRDPSTRKPNVKCEVMVPRRDGSTSRCCARAQWTLSTTLSVCTRHRMNPPDIAVIVESDEQDSWKSIDPLLEHRRTGKALLS